MGVFPFGAPVRVCGAGLPTRQHAVVALGAYPSALHARWSPPPGFGRMVVALPVDNEPVPFWDGERVDELITGWCDRYFNPKWGSVTPAALNGSSGRDLEKMWLHPLGYDRGNALVTDCLTTARASTGVARRLADRYAPVVEALGAPAADLDPHPSENAIVTEALSDNAARIIDQILAADPELVITLGNAAARVLAGLAGRPDRDGVLAPETYGQQRRIVLRDSEIRWQALIHPAAPRAWVDRHTAWTQTR